MKLSPGVLIGIVLVIAIGFPFISFCPVIQTHFSSTGQIGDTIGGITAPFINGLAAILVFYAFKEQVKANKLLQDDNRSTKNELLFNQIQEISKFELGKAIADLSRVADQLTLSSRSLSVNVYLGKILYFLNEFLLIKELIGDKVTSDNNLSYEKAKSVYRILFGPYLTKLEKDLNGWRGTPGNNHEVEIEAVLLGINEMKAYFIITDAYLTDAVSS